MSVELSWPIIRVYDEETPKPGLFVNYLTRQSMWRIHDMQGLEQYQDPIQPDPGIVQALVNTATEENIKEFVDDVMWSNHFCLLNALPPVVGTKWPVTEGIYWHFLEILPPLDYREKTKGFAISEASIGDIRSAYYFENGHYWHEYISMPGRE